MFRFGSSTIQLNKLVPLICKLVSDSNANVRLSIEFYWSTNFSKCQVRQQAIDTLVEIYRHVGEKVRSDIAKRGIPDAKYDLRNKKKTTHFNVLFRLD